MVGGFGVHVCVCAGGGGDGEKTGQLWGAPTGNAERGVILP